MPERALLRIRSRVRVAGEITCDANLRLGVEQHDVESADGREFGPVEVERLGGNDVEENKPSGRLAAGRAQSNRRGALRRPDLPKEGLEAKPLSGDLQRRGAESFVSRVERCNELCRLTRDVPVGRPVP